MRRGHPRNFEELRSEHGDRIFRFCYRLCGHTEDAEDLAQDVLLLAFQGFDRFQDRSSMTTWLYRIALNRWGRVKGARPDGQVPYDEDACPMSSPDPSRAGVERISLEGALAELPDVLRETFLLVKAEGLKYREAAEVLGVPQGTVQSRVHEATTRLRVLLAEPAGDPPGHGPNPGCLEGCASGEGGPR